MRQSIEKFGYNLFLCGMFVGAGFMMLTMRTKTGDPAPAWAIGMSAAFAIFFGLVARAHYQAAWQQWLRTLDKAGL